METGYIDRKTDTYMIVFIKRNQEFGEEYLHSKYKAALLLERKEERKRRIERVKEIIEEHQPAV